VASRRETEGKRRRRSNNRSSVDRSRGWMRRGRRPRAAPHRDEHDDALRRGLLERVLADELIVVRGVVRGRHLRSAPRASPRLDRARCPTGAARGLHTTPANARPTAGVARGRPSLRGSRAPARAPASPRGDPCRAVDRAESRRADACAPPAVRDRGDGRTMGASGKYGKVPRRPRRERSTGPRACNARIDDVGEC
jgi:hypothetical protein